MNDHQVRSFSLRERYNTSTMPQVILNLDVCIIIEPVQEFPQFLQFTAAMCETQIRFAKAAETKGEIRRAYVKK